MAGAGTYSGNNKLGSLGQYVATILPDREGNVIAGSAGNLQVHDDVLQLARRQRHDHAHVRAADVGSDDDSRRDAAELGRVEGERAAGMPEQRRVVRVQRRHAGDDLRRHRHERHFLDHERADIGAPPAAQGPGSFEGVRAEHLHHADRRGDLLAEDRHGRRDVSADAVRRLSDGRADCREHRRPGVRILRRSVAAGAAEIRDRSGRPVDELRAEAAGIGVNVSTDTGARARTACSWCRAALMWRAPRWRRRSARSTGRSSS